MAIMGTSLAVAAIFGPGTPEQVGEWVPQCFGTPDEPEVAAFCVSEPDAGSDVSSLRTRARVRRGDRRVGPQRPEGVGDQRRHRRTCTWSLRRSTATWARGGRPRSSIPPGTPGLDDGHEGRRSTDFAHRTPPTCSSTTAASRAAACSAARRSSTSGSRGRARGRGPRAGGDADVRGHPPDRRRAGARHRPRGLRVRARLRRASASSSAARSSRTRRSRSRSPT